MAEENTCTCAEHADECDGRTAVYYPLQDGGSCATGPCKKRFAPIRRLAEDFERRPSWMNSPSDCPPSTAGVRCDSEASSTTRNDTEN